MRPFTKAVFEREGKSIVGSRWTLEQVQQAYEKADDLLDVLAKCREDKYTKRTGLENGAGVIAISMLGDKLRKLPNESVQRLTLVVLGHLLERGLDVAATAADIYREAPHIFKMVYASSKPAFSKDKFFRHQFPVSSFRPFETQENPAICQNRKQSELYAKMYSDPYPHAGLCPGIDLMLGGVSVFSNGSTEAVKLFRETRWIQSQLKREDLLKEPVDRSNLKEVVALRMPASRE